MTRDVGDSGNADAAQVWGPPPVVADQLPAGEPKPPKPAQELAGIAPPDPAAAADQANWSPAGPTNQGPAIRGPANPPTPTGQPPEIPAYPPPGYAPDLTGPGQPTRVVPESGGPSWRPGWVIAIVSVVVLCAAAAALVTYEVHRRHARSAAALSGQTPSPPSESATAAGVPGGAGVAVSAPTGTSTPATGPATQPTPPTSGPLGPGDVPAGFRRVRGPGGLEVTLPATWPVHPGAVPENRQADAPDGSGRFVRFGATPAPPGSLLNALETDEATNPFIRQDYQRIQLAPVTYGSAQEAVDWEFTFTKNGQARHAYGRYWVRAGTEYVVYLSTPAATWNTTQNVLTVLLATASPVN